MDEPTLGGETADSGRFLVTAVSHQLQQYVHPLLTEKSLQQNFGITTIFEEVEDDYNTDSCSSKFSDEPLGNKDESLLTLSVPASLNYSYELSASQQLETIAAAPSLQYLDTIMESSEYVDTTQGSVLLARAARMIAKDKSKHSLLFNSTHVRRMRIDCYRRLVCIGAALLCVFASFQGLRNIQSSLPDYDHTLGLITFGCLRSLAWLGAILARPIMSKVTPKWTLVLAVGVMLSYPLSNFHRTAYTLIPSALLTGLGSGLIFSATNVYMLDLSAKYALLSMRGLTDVVGRFNSVIMILFHSSHLLGNTVLSLILSDDIKWFPSSLHETELDSHNSTLKAICGLDFYATQQEVSVPRVTDDWRYYMIFVTFSVLALVALFLCIILKPIKTKPTDDSVPDIVKRFVLTLFEPRVALLALPFSSFTGLAVSITAGDYNKMYVSCSYGIEYIGYISIAAACCSMLAAFLSARIIWKIGRIPVFLTASVAATSSFMLMLLWKPTPGAIQPVSFLPVMLWGVADGILLNQVMGYLSEMFRTEVTYALAAHHFYHGLGSLLGTLFSAFQWLSLTKMLYLAIAHSWVAFILLVCIEVLRRYNKIH